MYQAPPISFEPGACITVDRGRKYCVGQGPDRSRPFVSPTSCYWDIQHLYEEFTVKSEYAYDYGMPQWLARIDHILAPLHLEELFLGRHSSTISEFGIAINSLSM